MKLIESYGDTDFVWSSAPKANRASPRLLLVRVSWLRVMLRVMSCRNYTPSTR